MAGLSSVMLLIASAETVTVSFTLPELELDVHERDARRAQDHARSARTS